MSDKQLLDKIILTQERILDGQERTDTKVESWGKCICNLDDRIKALEKINTKKEKSRDNRILIASSILASVIATVTVTWLPSWVKGDVKQAKIEVVK
jgi:hypothetical protein